MAVDTRNKRASVLAIGRFGVVYPNPDGGVEQPDRQQSAYSYAGIDATISYTVPLGFLTTKSVLGTYATRAV